MSKKVSPKPMTKFDAARIQSATDQQDGGRVLVRLNSFGARAQRESARSAGNDEDDLVDFMVEHGNGSLEVTYRDNRTVREIGCRQVASYFQATKVLKRYFGLTGKM